ncbi:MAG: glycosyltransferase family 39 protein [Verrucomicrobiae bacterium]|nr:glycosyltransferase family 39 protein [Verrucomicrobiae bacterium]
MNDSKSEARTQAEPAMADPAQRIPAECHEGGRHVPPGSGKLYWFVALAGLCLFLITLTGLPELTGNEHRIGAYVMDAIRNGHWLVQRGFGGDVASKPPVLTWLVALATLGCGELTRLALYWPTAAATIVVALVLLAWGKRYFGWEAGLLSAVSYLFSPVGFNQMMSVRYDGLLALPVTLAALAAFRAWTLRTSWTWFWLAAAWGTLVKGPLALLLGAAGLLAVIWEKRTGHEAQLRGSHWWGGLCYLALCGGWFLLAYADLGQPLVDKMLGRELAGHVAGEGSSDRLLLGFYKPTGNVLAGYAPWSVFAVLGLWRVWRRPATSPDERRLERFLSCWFFVGLLVFSLAAHQRGRLIVPLVPAVALLAGRELAGWLRPRPLLKLATAFVAIMLVAVALYHHVARAWTREVQVTLGMRETAEVVRRTLGDQFPLVHVGASDSDTSFALQFYLNSAQPLASVERAAELLRGDYPAYVAVTGYGKHADQFENGLELLEIARWPQTGTPTVRVVGNQPVTEATSRLAMLHGPFAIRMDQVQLVGVYRHDFTFRVPESAGRISIQNQSSEQQTVGIRVLSSTGKPGDTIKRRRLAPQEIWSIAPDA